MPDYHDQLIEIYAASMVRDIELSGDYLTLCAAHAGDIRFETERGIVEKAKKRLETLLDPPMTRSQQVRAALVELRKKRDNQHCAIYAGLIERGYKSKWTDRQKDYFDWAWKLIQTKTLDFFFSFTARHLPKDVENPVNPDYKYFIRDRIGTLEYDTADRIKRNLLARSLYAWLTRDTYQGFIFTEEEYDNSMTMDKLQGKVSRSLVFIQMVQRIMFDKPTDNPNNYCFWEYEEARRQIFQDPGGEDRMLFIAAEASREEFPRVEDVVEEYEAWCRHLQDKDPPLLTRFVSPSDEKIEQFKTLLDRKIRSKLKAARDRIVDGVPSD